MTYRFHYIAGAFGLALVGCLGHPNQSRDSATKVEREIGRSLDGIEYRLRRLQSGDSPDSSAEQTLQELRRRREDLGRKLDGLMAKRDTTSDSLALDLQDQIHDLAIRYETARLGSLNSREAFQRAVNDRFEDLDRELAFLEGDVFQEDLGDRFEATLAHLYRLRNDVALLIAETAASSDEEFPRFRDELATAVGKLDITLAHATMQADKALEAKHPLGSLSKVWL
jgi:hypothetical protein